MYSSYLQPRKHYEKLYDKDTIALCRDGEDIINTVFSKLEKEVLADELKERSLAWYIEYSTLYFESVELPAMLRFIYRNPFIEESMKQDKQKDERLSSATLTAKPYCLKCGKRMAEFDRLYLRREGANAKKEDDILFMLKCHACNSRQALWQDGTEWEFAKTNCKKCGSEMTEEAKESKTGITTTYSCPACGHSYKDTYKFHKPTKKPVDPYAKLDLKRFCKIDEAIYNQLIAKGRQLERWFKLKAFEQSFDKVDKETKLHDAVQSLKKVKVAQLPGVLQAPLKQAGYIKLKLDPPQLGPDVIVGFSCLDDKAERSEYDSQKQLKKLVTTTLAETNWRLMSDGVSSRVGYLRGRLRAYENETDLKKLMNEESGEDNNTASAEANQPPFAGYVDAYTPEQNITIEKIKVLHGTLLAGTDIVPNGTKRPTKYFSLTGTLVPELRVIIPARSDDTAVPRFVKNFNFTQTTGGAPKEENG